MHCASSYVPLLATLLSQPGIVYGFAWCCVLSEEEGAQLLCFQGVKQTTAMSFQITNILCFDLMVTMKRSFAEASDYFLKMNHKSFL